MCTTYYCERNSEQLTLDEQDNVLISHDRRPVLSDFGLSRLQINSVTIAGTTTLKGNTRWMAPELIQAPNGSPNQMHTKATDVWAFGMVTYVGFMCNRSRKVDTYGNVASDMREGSVSRVQ